MATNVYGNALQRMVTDPNSFQGTPGFQFALDTGLRGVDRSAAARGMRGSGNALAELARYGTGLAQQDRGAEMDRLTRASGQEQQYGLGMEQNRLTGVRDANAMTLGTAQNANAATRNANDFTLGNAQNANAATRNANDLTLGQGQLDNTRLGNDQQFGLGMYQANNAFDLGNRNADNTAQNNWWNYDTQRTQNANTAANNQNNFNLASGRNDIDWFGANTARGAAQSADARGWRDLSQRR